MATDKKAPFFFNDELVFTPYQVRSLVLSFDEFGNRITSPGQVNERLEADEHRIYNVRLRRILLDLTDLGDADGTALNLVLKGDSHLPHLEGHGAAGNSRAVTLIPSAQNLTYPPFTPGWQDGTAIGIGNWVNVCEYDNLVLASDVNGRIKFGANPSIEILAPFAPNGQQPSFQKAVLELELDIRETLASQPIAQQGGGLKQAGTKRFF